MISLNGAFFCRTGRLNVISAQVVHHTHTDAVGQHVDDGPDAIPTRKHEADSEVRKFSSATDVYRGQKKSCSYIIQSTARTRETLSRGSPTAVSTTVMVTRLPCGIPAPPTAATVAVRLEIHSFKPLNDVVSA